MISARFINPHTDFGFKYLFGREETKGFLISLLNEILKGERQIKELEFMDKERVRAPMTTVPYFTMSCAGLTAERNLS